MLKVWIWIVIFAAVITWNSENHGTVEAKDPCEYCKFCQFCKHCPSCPCEGHYGCDYCKYCTYCTLCGLCDSFCEDGKLIGAMGTILEYSTRLLGFEPDVNYDSIDEDIQKGVEKAKKHKEAKQQQQQQKLHESHDEL